MVIRLFAWMGFGWAVKSRAVEDQQLLQEALVALNQSGIQLNSKTYDAIDYYCTEALEAAFERDYLVLKNRHAKRRARVGLVRCEMILNGGKYDLLEPELKRIADDEGLYVFPRRDSKDSYAERDEAGTKAEASE